MGAPKANLPLGYISLIGAAVATLKLVFRQVFVVTRDKTSLLDLGVEIPEDEHPLIVGWCGAESDRQQCRVAACDMPYLSAALIQDMAANLGDCDALIPEINGRLQTLHAFYNKSCRPSRRSWSAWVIPPYTPWP